MSVLKGRWPAAAEEKVRVAMKKPVKDMEQWEVDLTRAWLEDHTEEELDALLEATS